VIPTQSETDRHKNIPPVRSVTQTDQSIALSLVADRAEELDGLLAEISRQLRPIQEMILSDGRTDKHVNEIRQRLLFVDSLVSGVPTSTELRDEHFYWDTLSKQNGTFRKILSSRAAYLEDQIRFLEDQQSQWQGTWNQIHNRRGINEVLKRISKELNSIRSTRQLVQDQLTAVLAVQNIASQQDHEITEALFKLSKAQEQWRGRLLERDGLPLWRIREFRKLEQPMSTPVLQAAIREVRDTEAFLSANLVFIFALLLVYVLALTAAFRFKNYVNTSTANEASPEVLTIFSRPFSIALLLALLGTIGRLSRVTTGIACIFVWLWVIQGLRLLPPLIEPRARSVLRIMASFSMLESARLLIPFSAVLKRELFVLNVFVAFVTLIWLTRRWGLRALPAPSQGLWPFGVALRVVIVLLGASLACNFFGYRSLSQVLGICAFLGFIGAAALYGGVRVLTLILGTLLGTDWVRSALKSRAKAVEHWGTRGLVLGTALVWLRGMLQLLTIYDPLMGVVSGILERRLGYGNIRFTLGGALSVLLTALIGYALANLFSLVLKQVVLPKFPLNRGVSYAISNLVYYGLLLLVVTLSLKDAGVELSKLTVLTGAIGVGLGFGLQNIVNNFVSGLILLLERPVHIGDTVDVGGLVGKVRRIGARSSTVVTFEGAEVIVPNSNLISNQVINWTLSSAWRRVDIPVHVAYGTDPEKVLRLLVEAANSNQGVLRERPCTAFFLGFGENGLNFELRFWSGQQETWFDLRSEVTLAVAKALSKAGIEIPLPQRDLHLRSITASVEECLTENGSGLPSSSPESRPERSDAPHMSPDEAIGKPSVANSASKFHKA
jgi:small-conductance mechanosensitive channel